MPVAGHLWRQDVTLTLLCNELSHKTEERQGAVSPQPLLLLPPPSIKTVKNTSQGPGRLHCCRRDGIFFQLHLQLFLFNNH